MANEKATLEDRFWAKVAKSKRGCWEWTGSLSAAGYGQLFSGRGMNPHRAHRLSWTLHFGPIPNGLFVCHACDNPKCVRPGHLFLGTHVANMRDCANKKRAGTGRTIRENREKSHCPRGHAYTGDNLAIDRRGWRKCLACVTARSLSRSKTHYRRQGVGKRRGTAWALPVTTR